MKIGSIIKFFLLNNTQESITNGIIEYCADKIDEVVEVYNEKHYLRELINKYEIDSKDKKDVCDLLNEYIENINIDELAQKCTFKLDKFKEKLWIEFYNECQNIQFVKRNRIKLNQIIYEIANKIWDMVDNSELRRVLEEYILRIHNSSAGYYESLLSNQHVNHQSVMDILHNIREIVFELSSKSEESETEFYRETNLSPVDKTIQKYIKYYTETPMFLHKDNKEFTLEQIYVDPSFRIWYQVRGKSEYSLSKKKYNFQDIIEKFLEGRKTLLFLEADAGLGKSSLISWICYKYSFEPLFAKNVLKDRILICVNVRNFQETYYYKEPKEKDFFDYIGCQNGRDEFQEKFSNTIIIFDGIDEFRIEKEDSYGLIVNFLIELSNYLLNVNGRLILSSRTGFVNAEKFDRRNCFHVIMDHFDDEKTDIWLKNCSIFLGRDKIDDVKGIINNFKKNNLRGVVDTPLALYYLMSWCDTDELKSKKCYSWKLYNKILRCETCQPSYNGGKHLNFQNRLGDIYDYINYLAFQSLKSPQRPLSEIMSNEYDTIIKKCSVLGMYLGISNKRNNISFIDQSVLAFFLSEYIFKELKLESGSDIDFFVKNSCDIFQYDILSNSIWKLTVAFIYEKIIYEYEEDKNTLNRDCDEDEVSEHDDEDVSEDTSVDANEDINESNDVVDIYSLKERIEILAKSYVMNESMWNVQLCKKGLTRYEMIKNTLLNVLLFIRICAEPWFIAKNKSKDEYYRLCRSETGSDKVFNDWFDILKVRIELFDGNEVTLGKRIKYWSKDAQRIRLDNTFLQYANFENVDLSYADLSHADLRYAKLKNTDLSHADLQYANLSYSVLEGANLSYANLKNAKLEHAEMKSVKLKNAYLKNTSLIFSDLRNVDFKKTNNMSKAKLTIDADIDKEEIKLTDEQKNVVLKKGAIIEDGEKMKKGINLNVILVGSNPLPCYIQAAYALGGGEGVERPDYIIFVSTESGSATYVENIECVLMENGYDTDCNFKNVLEEKGYDIESIKKAFEDNKFKFGGTQNIRLNDGYEASEIEAVVKDKLEKLQRILNINSILLNNTGGTKAMAVYATMAVRAFCNDKGIDLTECFVDPQKNKIRCYKNSEIGTKDYPSKGDLRFCVKMEVDQLVYLHYGDCATVKCVDKNGLHVQKKSSLWKIKTEEQQVIARNIISNQVCFDAYKDFFETYELNSNIKNKEDRIKKILQDSDNDSVSNIDTILSVVNKSSSIGTREVAKIMTPFLNGKWLEDMFYRTILQVKEELKKENIDIDVAWSYVINKIASDVEQKEFEVDILVLRGYELTIFSVSMADGAGLVKGKWFEAVYRSEQVAGEHGKVALVTFINNQEDEYQINKLKLDLQTFKRDVELYNRDAMRDSEQLIEILKEKFR